MASYLEVLVNNTKDLFDKNFKGSLHSLLKDWVRNNKLESSPLIYDTKTKEFLEYINEFTTHDENDIVEKISKIITGFYVEDWQPNELKNYENELNKIINNIKKIDIDKVNANNKITLVNGSEKIEKYLSSNDNISAIGTTMKNNIEEIIDEYGASLSEQEKINILINIIKKYM